MAEECVEKCGSDGDYSGDGDDDYSGDGVDGAIGYGRSYHW